MKEVLKDLFFEGIESVKPENVVKESVKVGKNYIKIGKERFGKKPLYIFGAGKASYRMAKAITEILGDYIKGGVVISTEGEKLPGIDVYIGTHPYPSKENIIYSEKLINSLKALKGDDTFIFLLSGGASALLEKPIYPITLKDLVFTTDILLKSGLNIYEINAFRKHLSEVKGGRLARITKARGYILVISDVMGNDLGSIGSGPFYKDEYTYTDIYNLAIDRGIWDKLPESVKMVIERGLKGEIPETPKEVSHNVKHIVIADNRKALMGIHKKAKKLGLNSKIITSTLRGEVSCVAEVLFSICQEIYNFEKPFKPPVLLILGGETVVNVKGKGKGGRNQELVLHLLRMIKNNLTIYILACGTDGIDGITDFAGAVVGPEDWEKAMEMGVDIEGILRNNDSYTFHKALGTGIKTGYTGTNVADVLLIYIRGRL